MKRCIQCVHCRQDVIYFPHGCGVSKSINYGRERCALTDVVYATGSAGRLCVDERNDGACGPDATRFQRKPIHPPAPPEKRNWWQRLTAQRGPA